MTTTNTNTNTNTYYIHYSDLRIQEPRKPKKLRIEQALGLDDTTFIKHFFEKTQSKLKYFEEAVEYAEELAKNSNKVFFVIENLSSLSSNTGFIFDKLQFLVGKNIHFFVIEDNLKIHSYGLQSYLSSLQSFYDVSQKRKPKYSSRQLESLLEMKTKMNISYREVKEMTGVNPRVLQRFVAHKRLAEKEKAKQKQAFKNAYDTLFIDGDEELEIENSQALKLDKELIK